MPSRPCDFSIPKGQTLNLRDAIFTFGKHTGRRVSTVAMTHPTYLLWVSTIVAARNNATLWRALKGHLLIAAEAIERRHQQQTAEADALAERRQQRLAQRLAEIDAAEMA